MPSFSVHTDHQLGQDEAAHRLKGLLDKVKSRYQDQVSNFEENWNDNQLDFKFRTYGFDIKGSVVVSESEVNIDGKIPFAAMMFKGRIQQTIGDEMKKLLAG